MRSVIDGQVVSMEVDEPKGEGAQLASSLRFVRRRLGVILGSCLITIALAGLVAYSLTPQYTARASLMIDARQIHVTDVQSVLSGLTAENAVLRSELDVLNSPELMRNVADYLDLYSDPYFNPPPKPSRWAQWRDQGRALLASLLPAEMLPSWATEKEVPEEPGPLDEEAQERQVVEHLLSNFSTDNDGPSYTIKVCFTASDPEVAAEIVNAIVDQYLYDQLQAKREATRAANDWLVERLNELSEEVRNAELAVRRYREEHGLIESRGETVSEQQLAEINARLVEAQVERSQAEARLKAARSGNPDGLRDVEGATILWQLRSEEAALRRREAEQSSRYGPQHPEMLRLRAERADVQAKLREETNRVIESLAVAVQEAIAKEEALARALQERRQTTGTNQLAEVELNELIRQAESVSALYANFLRRYRETSEQEGLLRADARVVSEAQVPSKPSFPRPVLMMGAGGVLGLLFGLLIAAILELVDRGYRLSSQVERDTGVAVLGVGPLLRNRLEPSTYALCKPYSVFSEGVQSLRMTLQFGNTGEPHRIIMITSSVPSEGKTSLCMTLGRMAARSGARTLVVEADMRRPRMSHRLKLRPKGYLVDVLDGTYRLEDAVVEDRFSGMHILASRHGVSSPLERLASRRMAAFLESVRHRYDLVIVDTPPIMAVADAGPLAKVADAVLFVVRWGHTPRETVKAALRKLAIVDVKVTGIVLSQVDLKRQATYGYGDYGYHYDKYKSYYAD